MRRHVLHAILGIVVLVLSGVHTQADGPPHVHADRPGQVRDDGPPFDPQAALETFELAEGFQIEVFAAEPLISDPVDMAVDEYGRVYVVEMPGYPLDTSPNASIKLLSDTDGDGYPDESVVFATGFTLPTGVMRWKDGILVTAAPNVHYLEDTDGDNRADINEIVLTGFALSNPQGNFNNPVYGLDNGIHLANSGPTWTETFEKEFGDKGSEVKYVGRYAERNGGDLGINAGGRNVRFRPDTGELSAQSSRSQFGHTFDEWGRHFLVSNANHQFVEVIAARYLERNPALPVADALEDTPEHGAAADVFPITLDPEHTLLTDRGVFTSATGITFYNGGAFGAPYDQVAFVAEPVHNLVHADVVSSRGASFSAKRLFDAREFLASTDSWFRPVNFYVGPDGALYVIDYYREIVEHPEWMEDDAPLTRDLYRGKDRGRIYRITRTDAAGPAWVGADLLGGASMEDLVSALEHENAWWRRHAQRLLVDRKGEESVAPLRRMLQRSPSATARVHALWTLEGMGELEERDVRRSLRDPHARVRENAVLLAERHGAAAFEETLIDMADDDDARVRFQVLLTLGELETDAVSDARSRILRRDIGDSWVQIASLTARSMPGYDALMTAVEAPGYVRRVAMLLAATAEFAEVERSIDAALSRSDAAMLSGLAEGLRQREKGDVLGYASKAALIDVFFGSDQAALRGAALDVLRAAAPDVPDDGTLARAVEVAASDVADLELRADALSLVALADPAPVAEELRALLRSRAEPKVEAAAVRALGMTAAADVADTLLSAWPQLSVAARDEAVDAMMRSEARAQRLLDAVESGLIAPSAIGWNRRVILMRDWDGVVKERARRLLRVSEGDRSAVLQRYQAAVSIAGDAERGRDVFLAACSSCHVLGGEGAAFGPELGTVSHWSPHALVEAVLVPSRIIAYGFERWRVERRSGEVLIGMLRSETSTAVTLALQGGAEITVPRQDIASLQQLDGSAMPDGLEEQISVEKMADLLAFLRSGR